jgi:hypothetical protein
MIPDRDDEQRVAEAAQLLQLDQDEWVARRMAELMDIFTSAFVAERRTEATYPVE